MPNYETFNWNEGAVYIYTGTATASALLFLCENISMQLAHSWQDHKTMDGTYSYHLIEQRANLSIGQLYTVDATLFRIQNSATAVHWHIKNTGVNGSAGVYLYSGRIDSLAIQGRQGDVQQVAVQYHAHNWSAYGV